MTRRQDGAPRSAGEPVLRIGVSRCLLGEAVRYDGTDRGELVPFLRDARGEGLRAIEFLPVCPEVEAGMGVPREPVQLEGSRDAPSMIAVESRRDFTGIMTGFCLRRVPELGILHGFVFKKGSPSCGVRRVKRFASGPDSEPALDAMGLFAEAVARAHPGIPLVDETDLVDASAWERFLEEAARFAGRAGAG